jgi:hypothetical protein
VSINTGVAVPLARISRNIVSPSLPGSMRSSTTVL